jgi:uncharacterized protein YhhL (DUF1145 family)
MYSIAELELKYHDITELYDLAEELVETVESEFVVDPESQLMLIEPLAETVGESADILSEEFLAMANQQKSTNNSRSKTKIESALRKVYVAIDHYRKQVSSAAKNASQALMNIADPIVEKIKRQVEVIVAMMVDFVDISLDRIMQKAYIEELKQRQEKIAVMLHGISHGIGADPA